MFRRNLFKRVLPVVLSVAMLVGDLPVNALTAYAAPDTAVEESADAGEVLNENGTTEGVDGKSLTDDATGGESTDTTSVVPLTEVVVDRDQLVTTLGDRYDYTTDTLKVAYDPANEEGLAREITAAVKNVAAFKLNGVTENVAATRTLLKNQLTYKWQKANAEGAYVDLAEGELVQDAGKYQLVISLGAVENVCAAAEDVIVKLEIEKQEIKIERPVFKEVRPGSTVLEAKEANKDLRLLVNNEYVTATDYATAAPELTIVDAYTKTALADTDVLKADVDYIMTVNVTLKDVLTANYKLGENAFNFVLNNGYRTEIEITYKNPGARISKVYDGQAISEDVVKAAFTAKVMYQKDDAAEKSEVPGSAEALKYQWLDADEKLLAEAPVDAGTYYYEVYFEDADGNYQYSDATVTVFIDMAKVVVAPVAYDAGDIYVGDYTASILKNVKYEVYDVVNGVVSTTANAAYTDKFWGYAYNVDVKSGTTQVYEPVFKIQQGETKEEKTTWSDYAGQIKEGYSYRLIFTGLKAVYAANGATVNAIDINSAQTNYTVDISTAMLETYAKTLTVNATSAVTIKVDDILQDGKGTAFESPITVAYTGNDIYNDPRNKGAYKKAAAVTADGSTVASGTDASLTYTWQQLTYNINTLLDDDKNVKAPQKPTETSSQEDKDLWNAWEASWVDRNYNDVDNQSSPRAKGIYRLKINYTDASHKYGSAESYVYYVIKQQDLAVTLAGAPSVYADGVTTVDEFLGTIRTYVKETKGETVETIPNFITAVINPVDTITEAADGTATITKGTDEVTLTRNGYTAIQWMDKAPNNYFIVERQIKDGDNAGQWKQAAGDETFDADTVYRLTAKHATLNADYANYNFGRKIGLHTQVVKDDYYKSDVVAINVKKTNGVPVKITVDESKITKHTKVYDGQQFDLSELRSLIKVVTVTEDGSEGTDVTAQVAPTIQFRKGAAGTTYYTEAETIHAGVYYPVIRTVTDDNYYGSRAQLETAFVITKKEVNLIPVLAENVYAGVRRSMNNIVPNAAFKAVGLVAGDEDAIQAVAWDVYEAESNTAIGYNGILSSGKTYYVKTTPAGITYKTAAVEEYDEYGLPAYDYDDYGVRVGRKITVFTYADDYDCDEGILAFVPARKAVTVEAVNVKRTDDVTKSEAEVYSHSIVPVEGIGYNGGLTDILTGDDLVRSCYFRIIIHAPEEYQGTRSFFDTATAETTNGKRDYVYEQKITDAGAYITDRGANYIEVAFDAKADTKKYEFDILWDTDYPEHFAIDLSNASLLADRREAVAPKTLKFNGASTKMTVGSTQQLDVKITKAQQADVIWLGYSVDNADVLKVEENGFVTALKAGNATITVYPCKEDANGNKVALEDKGVKKATLKVKVSEVSAPKFSGLTAKDTYVNIKYNKPADGIRREVYILEGKAKPADFEAKIKEVTNGDFSAFAYAEFLSANRETNTILNGVVGTKDFLKIGGALQPNTQYTIYLRNVSGLRVMDDGTEVAASAAGSVKTFKTLKPQETGIRITPGSPAVKDDNAYVGTFRGNAGWVNSETGTIYKVKLSDKTVTLKTEARFLERFTQSYSDTPDYIWREIPLAKDLAKTYMAPKMVYLVSDVRYDTDPLVSGITYDEAKERGYVEFGGFYYEKTSKIATIDKKGKVTFKGKGKVFVVAYDANVATDPYLVDATYGDVEELYIYAAPDSMTAKAIKLYPGQSVYLSDFLSYKEGKTNLVNYEQEYADLTVAETSEDFAIAKATFGTSPYDDYHTDYSITALKKGKSITLNVTDAEVAKNGGKGVAVTVTSTELPAVKALKNYAVFDNYSEFTFQYPESSFKFRVKLTDARGSVLYDKINSYTAVADSYNPKTKMWTFVESVGPMTLLSQYNLSVAAVYGDEVSKEAKLKIKTTNIPAYYSEVTPELKKAGFYGMDVVVTTQSGGTPLNASINNVILKSGNDYTLQAIPDNDDAALRMTDTLTWKSSDSKVASIKSKPGTYTALLKTNKPGTTEISIVSKITKKVIARRDVTVTAVGEAGIGGQYYATNEPYDNSWFEYGFNGMALSGMDSVGVTLGTEVSTTLGAGQYQYFVFTAPALGSYSIATTNIAWMMKGDGDAFNNNSVLRKGETVTLFARNNAAGTKNVSVKVTGNMYQEAEVGNDKEISVKGGTTISFIAPEDNYYTAVYKNNSDEKEAYHESVAVNKDETGTLRIGSNVSSDKEYTVKIVKREAPVVDNAGVIGLAKYDGTEGTIKWVSYTAAEDNTYTFTFSISDVASDLKVRSYTALPGVTYNSALQNRYTQNYTEFNATLNTEGDKKIATVAEVQLKKGDSIYFALTTTSESVSVTTAAPAKKEVPEANALKPDTDNVITVGADEKTESWYTFTATEAGLYNFYLTSANKTFSPVYYYDSLAGNNGETLFGYNITAASENQEEISLKAGQKIYVKFIAEGATKEAPATAVLSITKRTAKALTLETANELTLTPVGAWYTVTIPETGVYTYSYKDVKLGDVDNSGDNIYIYQYSKLDDNSSYVESFSGNTERIYSAGQVLYLNIKHYGTNKNTSATAKLTLSKRTVPAANKLTMAADGVTVELKSGEVAWYSFTADENNLYNFTRSNVDGADYNITTVQYYNGLIAQNATGSFSASEVSLTKGQTIYVKFTAPTITEDDKTAKTKIVVTRRTVKEKALELGENAISVSTDRVAYYKFVATEDNKYTFTVSGVTEGNTMSTPVYSTDLLSNYYSWNTLSGEVDLKAGTTYYVRFNTTVVAEATAVVKITKREVTSTIAKATAKDISLTTADVVYYSFTAVESGQYTFTSTGVNKALNYGYADELTDAGTGRYLSASEDMQILFTSSMQAGDTVYIALKPTGTVSAEDAAKISIKVNQREGSVTPLHLGNDNSIKAPEKNTIYWYSFTSYEANVYNFGLKSVSGSLYMDFNDAGAVNYTADQENIATRSMQDEDMIYVAVYATNVETPAEATMTISKRIVTGALNTGTENGNSITLPKDGSDVWYSFEAPATGVYSVYALDSSGNIAVAKYYGLDYTGSYNGTSGTDFKMTEESFSKEDKRYFKFNATGTPESDVIAKVYVVQRELTGALSLSETTSVEIKQNEDKWYEFTAPEAGFYTIESTDATENLTARSYTSMEATYSTSIANDEKNFTTTRWFEKDAKLYIKVYSGAATKAAPVTAKIKVSVKTPDALSYGVQNVALTSTDEVLYSFTAPEENSTRYRIIVSGTNAAVKVRYTSNPAANSYSNTTVNTGNTRTIVDATLNQNASVVLALSSTAAATDNVVSAKITVQKYINDVDTLIDSQTVTLEAGEYQVIPFTAPQTGTYVFESSNNDMDTYGVLQANASDNEGIFSEITYLDSDDDSGAGTNFRLEYLMTAYDTVYLRARALGASASGSFDVTISRQGQGWIWYPTVE